MKYIAYGSNMVAEQMAFRCPNARLIGMGWLPNHRLEFYLHATVERSRARGAQVPVAVWEIDETDERSLDRYEGYPSYYTKHTRTVKIELCSSSTTGAWKRVSGRILRAEKAGRRK